MMKRAAAITALVAITIALAKAAPLIHSPATEFEGDTALPARSGTARSVHISVESWGIAGERGGKGTPQEIPLRGFYVAHLLSGDISTTIDGQTAQHLPGDYWAVRAGAAMQVKVLGEFAVLETTVVAKQ